MIRITAMVSIMVRCLLRARGADPRACAGVSNACATSPSVKLGRAFLLTAQIVVAILLTAEPARAQDTAKPAGTPAATHNDDLTATDVGLFLLGGAAGLGAPESGHL